MAVAHKLKPFIREFSLQSVHNICYGRYDRYLVTFSHYDRSIELFIDARLAALDRPSYERLRSLIQSNSNGYGVRSFQLTATGLSVVVGDKNADSLLDFFYMLINELQYLKVEGCESCTNCGRPIEGDEVIIKLGRHTHTCDVTCAARIQNGAHNNEKTVPTGHPVPGFLGALLFSLAATALYLYLGHRGVFCSWVAMLIPVAAALVFRLFGGRPSAMMAVVTVLFPLLFFPLAAFGLLSYEAGGMWYEQGYSFSIMELIREVSGYLTNVFSFSDSFVQRQLLAGGAFLALGLLFALPSCKGKKAAPYFLRLKG